MKKVLLYFSSFLAFLVLYFVVWIIGTVYFESFTDETIKISEPLDESITDIEQLKKNVNKFIKSEINPKLLADIYYLEKESELLKVVFHYRKESNQGNFFLTSDGAWLSTVDVYIDVKNKTVEEMHVYKGVNRLYSSPYRADDFKKYNFSLREQTRLEKLGATIEEYVQKLFIYVIALSSLIGGVLNLKYRTLCVLHLLLVFIIVFSGIDCAIDIFSLYVFMHVPYLLGRGLRKINMHYARSKEKTQ